MIGFAFRLVVVALLAFILLPAVVACIAAFDSRAIIAFPPQGFSWRWFERALGYEDFQIGFSNSFFVAAIAFHPRSPSAAGRPMRSTATAFAAR